MAEEKRAVLVYQNGLANVFEVDSFNMADFGRNARRLFQHSFGQCEAFAQGLAAAGWKVASAGCPMTGDIAKERWTPYLDGCPHTDKMNPLYSRVKPWFTPRT